MRSPQNEQGFTLVELLLSMAILLIVLSSISTALIVFLKNGSEALARDDHSGGVELVGSYLDRDVASAATTSTSMTSGSDGCSATAPLTANLLELTWTEYTASSSNPSPSPQASAYRAVYRLVTDPDGGLQLRRSSCLGTTLSDSTVLLRGLASSALATAAVATVASSTCASTQQLTMTLAAYSADTTTPYTFTTCLKTRITP